MAYFEPPLEVSSENSKLVVGKYDVISESAVFGDADYQVSTQRYFDKIMRNGAILYAVVWY